MCFFFCKCGELGDLKGGGWEKIRGGKKTLEHDMATFFHWEKFPFSLCGVGDCNSERKGKNWSKENAKKGAGDWGNQIFALWPKST